MKTLATRNVLLAIVVSLALAASALADTLILKTGERVTGYYEGGSARVVKFRSSSGDVRDYDILSVQQIQFSDDQKTTVLPTSDAPQLRTPAERPSSPPVSSNAANTGYTIPTGSKLTIRMIDSISSEKQSVGTTFIATLDEPIIQDGIEVAPKGADVRGRIATINDAGRLTGSAQLGLELTQIYVNGISYSVTTAEYSEVGESRTGQTARRAGLGAGVGAVIGAIAGGGKGAAIGAGVGAGGATAVQVMTKGEKLNIPSETRLEFMLRAPLVIAAK
ncbi:MAG TPA: hypothetical protein VK210_00450 [Terriglobia bacterium]|nr:hypothetical protein [Terriglobia bacterium]